MRDFDPEEEEAPEVREAMAEELRRREDEDARRRHVERFRATEARLAQQRADQKAETSRSRGRVVMLLAGSLVLCVGAFVAYSVLSLRERASADVSGQLAVFRGTGLSLAEAVPSKQGAPLTHATDVEGCVGFVAVGPGGPVDVTVTRASGAVHKGKGIVLCACATERVTASVPELDTKLPPGSAAIGVLRGTAEATGGLRAIARVPRDGIVYGDAPPPDCAEAQLDAWAPRAQMEEPPDDAKRAFPPIRGARIVAYAGADTALTTLSTTASLCYLAVASDAAKLRATGGKIVAEGRAIALCDGGTSRVFLKDKGTVTVAAFDAAKIGGLLGVVEAAAAAGLPAPATELDAATAKLQPKLTLVASALLAGNIESPDSLKPAPTMRALALGRAAGDIRDPKLTCSPPWPSPVAVCLLPPGQGSAISAQTAALAVAPLGGISGALASVKDPAAATAASHLLALARRLGRDGFEPTMMESARDVGGGTEVTARQGDAEIVAVTVQPTPPYVVPLSSGKPWKLGDAPPTTPIGASKGVMMSGAGLTTPSNRRTVVWRRGPS
ncbi:MAG: hypothetical protein IT374_12660 [Polyangiaceae bacterium]|nr:hypothetical protein [Polyangiaceae bacterium]